MLDEPTKGLDEASEREVVADSSGSSAAARHRHHALAGARRARGPDDRAAAGRIARAPTGLARRRGDIPPIPRDSGCRPAHAARPRRDAPRLAASLGTGPEVTDVRIRYLRYKPGTNVVVHYDVGIDGRTRSDAIAMTAAGRLPRSPGARSRRALALASLVRRPGARWPSLGYDEDDPRARAVVSARSRDPRARGAALRDPREELEAAGAGVDEGGRRSGQVLAYKPRRRAVLRVGEDVAKFYAEGRRVRGRRRRAPRVQARQRRPEPGAGRHAGGTPRHRPALSRRHPGRKRRTRLWPAGALLAASSTRGSGPARHRRPGGRLDAAAATAGLGRGALGLARAPCRARCSSVWRAPLPAGAAARVLARWLRLAPAPRPRRRGLTLVDFDALCRAPRRARSRHLRRVVVLGGEGGLGRARGGARGVAGGDAAPRPRRSGGTSRLASSAGPRGRSDTSSPNGPSAWARCSRRRRRPPRERASPSAVSELPWSSRS